MDLRQPLLGHLTVEVELEPLSLSYVADALEPQPGKGTVHCLALRVEDFGLEHDVDDDTGHGTAPEDCGFGGVSLEAGAGGPPVWGFSGGGFGRRAAGPPPPRAVVGAPLSPVP